MDKEQLLELERASIDLTSPPYAVSTERRRHAEAVFMEFKKLKSPYNACKFILENSQLDFVLFQSASTMREAMVREWPLLAGEEKAGLRQYLLHYLTRRLYLTTYVQKQVLYALALLVKRASLEPGFAELFRSVLDSVAQLLATGEVKVRLLGCSLLTVLLTEYSSSSGSSSIGLPMEFHLQCKKVIEKEQLLQVLQFAVQVLQQFAGLENHTFSKEDHTLFSSFLQLASQVLNWDFLQQQQRFFRTNPESINIVLRPPRAYASTFLDPGFLALFFQLLHKLRASENDFHHVVQCLTQLASLTKPVFSTEHEQSEYLVGFVTLLLEYVQSSVELSQQEVYGLSCVFRRLTTIFSVDHFTMVGSVKMEAFLQALSQLTCLSAQKTVNTEDEDQSLGYREALEHYLEVCVSVLAFWDSSPPNLPHNFFVWPMTNIFDAYIKSKLLSPKGWRSVTTAEEEIFDIQEDDRVMYADELSSVGCIARAIACHSLPLLVSLLGERTNQCLQLLLLIQRNTMALGNQSLLDGIYEDLHWLTLLAGFTLCDIVRGEAVLIPTKLMKHSIDYQSYELQRKDGRKSDREDTAIVASVDFDRNIVALILDHDAAGDAQKPELSELDPVVALVLSVCRLCLLEKKFIAEGLVDLLSPQLCESIVWCLQRIAEPYVMFVDENYQQVSLSLVAAFGKDSKSGQWLTSFLVEKVAFNLTVWSAEESLAHTSIQLLQSLVKSVPRAGVCIQCDVLWSLMRSFSAGSDFISVLSPRIQRSLMGSLIMSAMGERKKEFLTHLLQSLETRFSSLVHAPNFATLCQRSDTKLALLTLLESMCGLASCTRVAYSLEFFQYLLPVLRVGVNLLAVYAGLADVVTVILELYVLVAENYIIFLDQAGTLQFFEVTLQLIQTYTKCNSVKYRNICLVEEEQCEDLLLFMKLLSHLTAKNYLDFGPVESASPGKVKVEVVDVVMSGMGMVLPLITEEILKFPKMCAEFYTLLHYTCLSFPGKVLSLSEKMVLSFMELLETGLNNFTQDICSDCLESVESLAAHYGSSPHLHSLSSLTQSLQHLLKVLFELVLSISFDMDLVGPAAAAIFSLICTQQNYYSSLAEALINSQSCDPKNHSRSVKAFQQLTPPTLNLDLSQTSKQTFRVNLEQFLPSIKGFLIYR